MDNVLAMIRANTGLDIEEVFAPGGLISRCYAGFEERPQQVQMARAVQQALADGRHLVVEAGTGVGKSFAYLIPAIEIACQKKDKVLISTFTITLQEQLTDKDIPFLVDCLPYRFTAALAKGRGNYLCKRRLEFALRRQMGLFDESGAELSKINDWANQTKDGSLSDLPFVPRNLVWDAVNSGHGNCRGRRCPHFGKCFYWRARRQLDGADIIVANHALMFCDLVLKKQAASVLPKYRYIVIDEAQNIEHVAEEHFGIDISNHRVKFLLNGLYNPRTHKGLLAYARADRAIDIIGQITKEARSFFRKVRNWYEQTKGQSNGRCYQNFVDDTLSGHLKNLRAELTKLAKNAKDVDEKFEMLRFVDRCTALAVDLDCFLTQRRADYVYWVEVNGGKRATVRLKSAAVNVGPDVKKCLFDEYESVIMTSATLSTGPSHNINRKEHRENEIKMDSCFRRNDNLKKLHGPCELGGQTSGFDFFAGRVGLDDFDALCLGSPFDYQRQVTMYIEKDLPNPNDPAFSEAAVESLKKYIRQTDGRAFVLFTSYEMLDDMAERLSDWLARNNIELLQQGQALDRSALLKRFRSKGSHVLFGTDSFWQGVDVPGEALSNVIIVRLPFAVPDKPLIAGRLEQISQQGGNPFYDYQLPSAIIKFKQGFGRLIRRKTDTGVIVILDSRIVNKSYGERFLAAIPECKMKIVARDP